MNEPPYTDICVEERSGATWVTIDRPGRMNALRERTYEELAAALEDVAGRPEIGAVVLTGRADRAFSAGGDTEMATTALTSVDAARHHHFRRMIRLSELVVALDKPVIAAVNGLAIGGAVELVTFCDLVVAAESSWFQLNGTAIGGCSWWGAPQLLPIQIGLRRAEEILLLGRRVSATEAAAIGMINEVVPDGELRRRVEQLCEQILGLSPEGLRLTKEALRSTKEVMLASMSAAAEANAGAVAGPDLQEAFRSMRAGTALDWRARRRAP